MASSAEVVNVDSAPEITLRRLQAELVSWQEHNFPGRPSWQPLLGAFEEVGELSHAFLKRAQGIRGTPAEHHAAMADAVADTIVFLADFCNTEKIDLQAVLDRTWAQVKQRDFKRFPRNGRTE